MQLGTRWRAGAKPPARLAPEFTAALRAVEAELPPEEDGVASWTLTWLEGRPVAELDLGTVVTVDTAGRVAVDRSGEEPEAG